MINIQNILQGEDRYYTKDVGKWDYHLAHFLIEKQRT